jgi:hypothetical protein
MTVRADAEPLDAAKWNVNRVDTSGHRTAISSAARLPTAAWSPRPRLSLSRVQAEAPEPGDALEYLVGRLVQREVVVLEVAEAAEVAQRQRTVAAHVDIPDADVGLARAQAALAAQRLAHTAVADAAVRSATQIVQMGVPIAHCELLDVNAVRWFNRQSRLGLHESRMLLMEFHGSAAGAKEQTETVQAIAS